MRSTRAAEVLQHGKYSPVRVGRRVDVELEENLGDVGFDGSFGDAQRFGDRLVRTSFGDELEYLVFARRQGGDRIVRPVAVEESRDDSRIDDGLAFTQPGQRVGEHRTGEHSVLQEIAG